MKKPLAVCGRAGASVSENNSSTAILSEIESSAQGTLVTALDYAARGFAVFPILERSKAPACSRGFREGTTNPARIRRWFGSFHRYNIGIATGLISGAWVFDVDGSDGAMALAELEAAHGPLQVTLTSITSAGCHFWFRADRPLPSSAGRIGPGLDVRADGGYVLAPPSEHPDGATYRWSNASDLALAPGWLVQRAYRKPIAAPAATTLHTIKRRPVTSASAYGRAALERECAALARAPCGTRNHALNRASFNLHQLVSTAQLDIDEVHDALIAAATANGVMTDPDDGPQKVEATIASGARAGLQHPRSA